MSYFYFFYVLSSRTQRRTLPAYQSEEIKILNFSFSHVKIEPTTNRVYPRTLVLLRQNFFHNKILFK